MATKIGSRQFVVVYDEVVWGARMSKNPRALDWVLAHELAHHALGHTGLFRGSVAANFPSLSRKDELSADAVANALVNDAEAGREALLLLLVGAHLAGAVDRDALMAQAAEVYADDTSRSAERSFRLSHPLLLRRIAQLGAK